MILSFSSLARSLGMVALRAAKSDSNFSPRLAEEEEEEEEAAMARCLALQGRTGKI